VLEEDGDAVVPSAWVLLVDTLLISPFFPSAIGAICIELPCQLDTTPKTSMDVLQRNLLNHTNVTGRNM